MVVSTTKSLPAKNLKQVASYLPPAIYEKLEAIATKERRTMSQMTLILLEEAIEARESKEANKEN
ncbi:hypothetical protein NIES2119_31500 [[Phormidium ambiguum] IAM M-71]|uniref:CopG-like ribbon-helix-helix domain-containing protein n=1 Tax=[Phormidium ambiguum] IAM M-71 TaxID=454136 RepID=A0A1U7I275_9CYAN|nr:hypothetical protein [Phormidium ambiguum]OKH30130.1 hypothetical protein NIES2119_31500 [Phormidium ambiguum IAM M-71]